MSAQKLRRHLLNPMNAYDWCWKLSVGIQLDRGYVVRIAMRCRRSCEVGYENGGEVLLSVMMYIIVYNIM